MRIFIAIDLPGSVRERLRKPGVEIPGARWVPLEQLHLTLAFLGELSDADCRQVAARLAEIRSPSFPLRFARHGCFPHPRNPRVLWIGLQPEPLLAVLAGQVRQAVLDSGIPQEDRPFTPHITLARCRQPVAGEVGRFLAGKTGVEDEVVTVREFILYQSILGSGSALHLPLQRFPLEAGK